MTRAERSWILNDWANSAYTVAITTAILPIYFKNVAAQGLEPHQATAYWGYGSTAFALLAALLAPLLGTLADYRGYKKSLFAIFTVIGAVFTASLAVVGPGDWMLGILLFGLSSLGFTCMVTCYDAFLVDVTDKGRMDWISSSGYAWGYIGSTIPFIASILLILHPDRFGLPSTQVATRTSFVLIAIWWLLFSLPMLKDVHQSHGLAPSPHPLRDTLGRLRETFRDLGRYREAFLFLIAYFFYIDGISSLIKMSALLGLDLGISSQSLLGMILALQAAAFPFALLYGKLAERIPAKHLILVGIVVFLGVSLAAPFLRSEAHFWILTILMASSLGGVQSLSRSIFGKLIPPERSAEFFGFFNVMGKFAAVFGPFLMGLLTQASGNARIASLALVPFFAIGGIMLARHPGTRI